MLKTDTTSSTTRALYVSHSLTNIISKLDSDIEALVGAIPLQNNAPIEEFTNLLRQNITNVEASNLLSTDPDRLYDNLVEKFTPQLPIFTIEETHDYRDVFEVKLKDNFGLITKDNKLVDLATPNSPSRYIKSIIVQTDNNKTINPREHKDKNDLTINFYSVGRGVKYFIHGNEVTMPSPCITVHRGTTHEFGEAGAVPHTGQTNEEQQAANIVFVFRSTRKHAISSLIAY